MKIKIYIVTYNNNFALNNTLESLFNSKLDHHDISINLINNHSNLSLNSKFSSINIIHNTVRPDFSTGHLARDWNCALINGFKSLINPDCDIVVTCQNDTNFAVDWVDKLLSYHQKYCFFTACPGDGFCSYQTSAILRVGLWDERFNSIEFQEADYFMRNKLFNKDWCSINDFNHKRLLNQELPNEADKSFVWRSTLYDQEIHATSSKNHNINYNLLMKKFRTNEFSNFSSYENKQTVLYPYFEKDILGLPEKYEMYGFAG